MSPTRCTFAIAVLLATAAARGAAVVPPAPTSLEIPVATPPRDPFRQAATVEARAALETTLAARLGGEWQVAVWNEATSTPHYMLGSGVETGTLLTSDDDAIALAWRHVALSPDVFAGRGRDDLELFDVRRGRGKVAVHFKQVYEGVPVIGARAHLTYTEAGRLFVMSSDLHREVGVDVVPTLSSSDAARRARLALASHANVQEKDGEPELVIMPAPRGEGETRHQLVWRVSVRTSSPVGIWVTLVDAHDGTILQRTNDVHFAALSGFVTSQVQPTTSCNAVQTHPASYCHVRLIDVATVTTNGAGYWEHRTRSSVLGASATLNGPYCIVRNHAGDDAVAWAQGDVEEHSLDISFDDGNSQADERAAFAAVNAAHDYYETFAPGFAFTNQPVVVNVSRAGACNAYWDGAVNCFIAGGGCSNTGEIQSIVLHELGHGAQAATVGGQGEQGLGEGNADVLANLLTGESAIGRGFYENQCNRAIRDSDNSLRYPEDVVGVERHSAGRVIAGFHWDVLDDLQDSLGFFPGRQEAGSLWHFARWLEIPWTQPAQVLATFIAADDDGNLFNGSPHCSTLNEAAYRHGFATINCGIVFAHTPVDTRTSAGDVSVAAWIPSPDTGAAVTYSINGSAARTTTMSIVGGGIRSATLIDLDMNDEVRYYVVVADKSAFATSPYGALFGERHTFDIAAAWFDMERSSDWQANVEGLDDALTGQWERVIPNPTSVQPGQDHTGAGSYCWVTGQQPLGDSNNGANDVDLGTTRLYSPWFDLTNAKTAIARYWRFYSNNSGSEPDFDVFTVEARNLAGRWEMIESTNVSSNAWVRVEHDLLAHFGANLSVVQLRFSVSDLEDPSLVEAALDDFAILTDVGDPTTRYPQPDPKPSTSRPPTATFLAGPEPNPFNPRTTLVYGLEAAGPVTLRIYDVSGRLLRTLVDGVQPAGRHQVTWSARSDDRRSFAPGVYFAELRAGTFRSTVSLTRTR